MSIRHPVQCYRVTTHVLLYLMQNGEANKSGHDGEVASYRQYFLGGGVRPRVPHGRS